MREYCHRYLRLFVLLLLAGVSSEALAGAGVTNYSMNASALSDLNEWIIVFGVYVVSAIYAGGAVLAVYGATTIYIKLQTGDEGFLKSCFMLVGAILFLLSAVKVIPGFFGRGAGVPLW